MRSCPLILLALVSVSLGCTGLRGSARSRDAANVACGGLECIAD